MDIEFDPAKEAINIEKHGISLARAVDLEVLALIEDDRFEEARFRIYGHIDGLPYCAAGTRRGQKVRIINLRRAHRKEMDRYV
tara:strand:+ start:132 stop:380 length:249 start_codon:yes stop_codon:yes gene_type:complete